MFRRIALVTVLCLPMLLGLAAQGTAQEASPSAGGELTILGPDESYAGRTRAEWDTQEWQWIVSFPVDINPGLQETGERCGYGQSGPVFFLPGSFTPEPKEITCVVPEGMAIFAGLGGSECSTVEPPPFFGRTEAELASCATAATDILVGLEVTVNGEEIPDVMSYRTVSPMFTMTFPEDNLFGVPAGTANAVSDSYSIIIAPPPPGEYEITVTTTIEGQPEPFTNTVTFIVQPVQVVEPQASPEASPMASPAT